MSAAIILRESCILSKFYIKPQQSSDCLICFEVVSYRNSTSNHNFDVILTVEPRVVSYRNSTSNHNCFADIFRRTIVVSYRNSTSNHNTSSGEKRRCAVVSYRNSTSNHNHSRINMMVFELYLIEILHQTTTFPCASCAGRELYLIEILHQTTTKVPTCN